MSLRDCAINDEAFAALRYIYENREEALKTFRENGQKIVLRMGTDINEPAILAAGMFPVHIYADADKELVEAEKYLDDSFDPIARGWFEKLIDGTYAELVDEIVVSKANEKAAKVAAKVEEICAAEPERKVPHITWFESGEEGLKQFVADMSAVSGKEITEEDLEKEKLRCQAAKEAMDKITALRTAAVPHINGSEALIISGAGLFMEKTAYIYILCELAQHARTWPLCEGPRVYFTGSNQEDNMLFSLLEDTGCVIVGEDMDWGAANLLGSFGPLKVHGAIFYGHEGDKTFPDYPEQKKNLDAAGIKSVCWENQKYPMYLNDELPLMADEFIFPMQLGAFSGLV